LFRAHIGQMRVTQDEKYLENWLEIFAPTRASQSGFSAVTKTTSERV